MCIKYKEEQEIHKSNYGNTYMKHYKKNVINPYNNQNETKIVNAYAEIDVADVLGHKDIETTENYYISSTDETRKNVIDSYESTINLDVIDEIKFK